jgi:hypothetical protein
MDRAIQYRSRTRLCLEGCARTLSPRKKRLMDPATPIEMDRLGCGWHKRKILALGAVSLRLSHSGVGAQLTSHLGKLKVPELCLAAFTASCAIDGNARKSSAG